MGRGGESIGRGEVAVKNRYTRHGAARSFMGFAPKIRFAPDSPLEGDGFEPSVPGTKGPVFVAEGELRNRTGAAKKGCFLYGTDGSNPAKTLVWPSTPPTARVIFRGSRS
jgi:hypothetical protein